MAKQLNINLGFNADTSQAKQQIMELRNSLTELTTNSIASSKLPITKSIMEAQQAAASLKIALDGAINTNTGKLDLSKFSSSLNKAGLDLATLKTQLTALGPAGASTFQSLATSIMRAEVPLTRTNAMLTQMWTTLKNTARWQLSSSMLHGFMSTISSAFSYAKNLDQSLNNIRVVTNKSAEEMARFAEQANQAARALNTTTTAYTNASLIYYQQGLSAEEVKARTDVTIKMANVSRQSAEIVSDQMTAVWNNFDDGSKSLEYYADVMTALGAKTASSTDEIAGGLEKFAAVAETIGLSYEYAASALATITAETRQSEDVVGTALKTIFARIQGLKLGETLEDGTELNKYSQALKSVGIDIFDANKELKDMDTILNEMGSKWQTLSRDQQTALAQTVAGVRQYNQLMSLMNNWDVMQENLHTSYNAKGALDEQAETYAEGWEAARDKVKAAAEDVYDSLIDEDTMKGLLEGLEDILNMIGGLIDSLNGLPGVLSAVGLIMTKVFGPQMAAGLERIAYNFKSLVGVNAKNAANMQNQAHALASDMNYTAGTDAGAASAKAMGDQLQLQNTLRLNAKNMTEEERNRFQALIEINKAYGEQAVLAAKARDAAMDKANATSGDIRAKVMRANTGQTNTEKAADYTKARAEMKRIVKEGADAQQALERVNAKLSSGGNISGYNKQLERVINTFNNLGRTDVSAKIEKAMASFQKTGNLDAFQKKIQAIINSNELLDDSVIAASDAFRELLAECGLTTNEVDKLANEEMDLALKTNTAGNSMKGLEKNTEQLRLKMEGYKKAMTQWSQSIVNAFSGIASLSMGINSLIGMFQTLNNQDLSFGEKLLQSITSLSMAVPSLMYGLKGLHEMWTLLKKVLNADTIAKGLNAAATWLQIKANDKLQKEQLETAGTTKADTEATKENTKEKVKNAVVDKATSGKGGKGGGKVPSGGKGGTGGLKGAFSNFGKSAGNFLKSYKGTFAKVGLVAAGIAIAVTSISMAVQHFNKDAIAAEKAAKNAQVAAEMYQNASDAYNQFTNNVQQYKDGVDNLKDLERGTLEYREAVLKANESILELIRSNKELKYTVDEDGLIVVDEESLAQAQATQLKILQNAQATKAIAQQNADNLQLRADQTEFNRKYANGSGWSSEDTAWMGGSIGAGVGGGLAIGAMIGGSAGPIGMAIGAGVGLIVGAIGALAGEDSEEEEDEALEILKEAYEKKGNSIFTEEGIKAELDGKVSSDLVDSLVENADKTQDMVVALSNNEKASLALTEALLKSENPELYNNEEISEENQEKLWDITTEEVNKKSKDLYEKKYKDKGKLGGGMTDEEVQKAYAKAMGWDPNLVKNESGNKATYYDKDGKEVVLSDETVRLFLAEQEAKQDLDQNAQVKQAEMIKMQNLALDGYNIGDLLTSVVQDGTLNDANASDIDLILNSTDQIGSLITDDMVKALGYESKEDYLNTLKEGAEQYSKDLQTAQAELMSALGENSLVGADQLTLEGTKVLNKMLDGASTEQKKKIVSDFNEIIGSVSEENQDDIIKALFDTDWSSIDSVEAFQEQLEAFGSEIDITNGKWNDFKNNLMTGSGIPILDDMNNAIDALLGFERARDSENQGDERYDKTTKDKMIGTGAASEDDFIVTATNDKGEATEWAYINGSPEAAYDAAQNKAMSGYITNKNIEYQHGDEMGYKASGDGAFKGKTWQEILNAGNGKKATVWNAEDSGSWKQTTEWYRQLLGANPNYVYSDPGNSFSGSSDEYYHNLYNYLNNADNRAALGITDEEFANMTGSFTKKKWSTETTHYDKDGFGNIYATHQGEWVDGETIKVINPESAEFKELMGNKSTYETATSEASRAVNEKALSQGVDNIFDLEPITVGAHRDASDKGLMDEYGKGLGMLAVEYESCRDELQEYNKVMKASDDALGGSTKAAEKRKDAENKLKKALKDAAWNQVTKEIEESMDALKDTKDLEQRAEIFKEMATSMNKHLGTAIDPSWIQDNLGLIEQWYNSTGVKAQELAMKIQALAAAASADLENLELPNIEAEIDVNDDGVISVEEKYAALKSIIEANPITVNAQGKADLSNLINALVEAGVDAQWLASYLASIGQTEVTIEGYGDDLPIDLTTEEGLAEFAEAIANWDGGIKATGGYVPAEGVADMSNVGNPNTGGGGGSKPKKPAKREEIEPEERKEDKEIERYHAINKELDEMNRQLSEVSKNKDVAWGKSKINMIDQEIKKTRQLAQANERYIASLEADLPKDADKVREYGGIIENGIIVNYEQIYKDAQSRYNAAMDEVDRQKNIAEDLRVQIENMEEDGQAKWDLEDQRDAANDAAEKAKKDADEAFEDFEEVIETYEKTYEDWQKALEQRAQYVRDEMSLKLEEITAEVEIEITVSDYSIEILDYFLERLDDTKFKKAEDLVKFYGHVNSKSLEKMGQSDSYQEGILSIMGTDNFKKFSEYDGDLPDIIGLMQQRPEQLEEVGLGFLLNEFTDEEIQSLTEYGNSLMEVNRAFYEMDELIEGSVLEAMDEWGEKIDANIERYSTYNSILSSYRDIVTLSGRTLQDSDLLREVGQKERENAINELASNKDNYDMLKQAEADALTQLENARANGTEEDIRYWEETYEETVKRAEEAHATMQESWVNALQVAQDEFTNNIDLIIKEMELAIAGSYGTLENMQNNFDLAQTEKDRYVEDYEKAYNLNKLYRQLDSQLDSTDNIKAKERLLALQKELNKYAEEGVEMSQYELEYLQKKYEMELAAIALEEARNAKTQVRLSRDTEGNFGYVYTADQNNIAEATQNLEDKLYEMEKMSFEYIEEMSSAVLSNQQEMSAALAEAHQRYLDGAYESEDDYYHDLERIQNWYLEQDEYLRKEIVKGIDGVNETREIRGDELTDLLQDDVTNNIAAYNNEEISYGETVLGQIEDATSWRTAHNNLVTEVTIGTGKMGTAFQTWRNTVSEVYQAAGTTVENFKNDASADIQETGNKSNALKQQIQADTQTASGFIQQSMTEVTNWQTHWNNEIQKMINKNNDFILSVQAVLQAQGKIDGDTYEGPGDSAPPVDSTPQTSSNDSSSSDNKGISNADMVQLVYDMGIGTYANNPNRKQLVSNKYSEAIYNAAQGILNSAIANDNWNYHHNGTKWKNETVQNLVNAAGYDTGGYTGAWGDNGKLAILHEKELVLNATDTENFLSGINILREISQMLDNNALFSALGQATLSAMGIDNSSADQLLQQEVTIHADFPNVQDHSEIEIAINNLVNAASQYANR